MGIRGSCVVPFGRYSLGTIGICLFPKGFFLDIGRKIV